MPSVLPFLAPTLSGQCTLTHPFITSAPRGEGVALKRTRGRGTKNLYILRTSKVDGPSPVLYGNGVCGEVVVGGLDADEEGTAPPRAHDLAREQPRLEGARERPLHLLDEQLHELPAVGRVNRNSLKNQ